jgi:hypothetical protein
MNGPSCKLAYLVRFSTTISPASCVIFQELLHRITFQQRVSHIILIFHAYIHILLADDILHARIQTMGVAEHVFDVNIHGKMVTWHLYDVGGARGQRHTWVPYFDDANAIIFVAPVSAFDQVRSYSLSMLLLNYAF